jgi:hypothetical protein
VGLGAAAGEERTPRKSEASRWNAGKDLSFTPLRLERVVEVRYDYLEGGSTSPTFSLVPDAAAHFGS